MLLPNRGRSSRLRAAVVATTALLLVAGHAGAVPQGGCPPVVVTVDWDSRRAETVSGVVVRVSYPPSLDMPASGKPVSAKDRVELLGGTSGGLFDAVPRDSDGDGRTDLLSIGLVTRGIPSGRFARIRFDCAAGPAAASTPKLGCVSDVADDTGSVPSSCSVTPEAE